MRSWFRSMARVCAAGLLAAALTTVPTGWSTAAVAGGIVEKPIAMRFSGQAGCNALIGDACSRFDHASPRGAVDWTKADSRAIPGAASMSVSGNVSFVEERDAAGNFRSATVMAHLETSVSGFGDSRAQFDYELDLEDPAMTELDITGIVTLAGTGGANVGALGNAEVEVHCDEEFQVEAFMQAGLGEPNSQTDANPLGGRVSVGDGDCSIVVDGNISTGAVREAPGLSGRTTLDVAVTVSAAGDPPPCSGVQGTVFDGPAPSGHRNPMPGVQVRLYREGAAVGPVVATEDDGTWCVPTGDGVEPGDYAARASLVDARHDPPLFETQIHGIAGPVFAEVPVTAADFSEEREVDITFADEAAKPHQSDAANIHWQSTRFVDWLLATGLTPQTLTRFTVVTFDSSSTSSHYDTRTTPPSAHVALAPAGGVGPGKSSYLARNDPFDNGPENAEWHEIGHHVGHVLGVADIYGPPCAARIVHGGWLNGTTCDSLGEGFATWIAGAASIAIDAGRGGGYGTPFYAQFVNLESGGWRPWTLVPIGGGASAGREDFVVASLLWDLADDTPGETGLMIRAKDPDAPIDGSGLFDMSARDRIALGDAAIIRILAERRPQTVVDLFEALKVDPALPAEASIRDLDIDGDGAGDVTPLEEAFLMHGFHPVHDLIFPRFVLGDPVSRSDRETTLSIGLQSRSTVETIPNAYVRLQNGTDADETFTIDAAFAGGSVSRSVTVPPHSTRLEYLEVPPFYVGILEPGAALPACGGANQEPIEITISGASGGAEPKALDSCEYWHAIVSATDGAAVTYTVGSGPFESNAEPSAAAGQSGGPSAGAAQSGGPSAGPSDPASGDTPASLPILLVAVGAIILLVGVLFLRARRHRGTVG